MKPNPLLVLCSLVLGVSVITVTRAVPLDAGPAPKTAWIVPVSNNWELRDGLPMNLMKISPEGLANTDAPRVYIEYTPQWPFHDYIRVLDFYRTRYGIKFTRLNTPDEVLDALGQYAQGYVVWDQNVRASINVALTAAGLMRGVVVDASLIPQMQKHGLKELADFRGKFDGQSDAQIYQWAYDHYWKDCSRDFIVWMGGEAGPVMQPGVADMAIAMRAFVTDLSADPRDTAGYDLQKKLLAQLHPAAWIYGWHSYPKDTEGQWVTLTSSYGLKVMGLNTFPNASFMSQIGFTPGFKFSNNNHVTRDEKLVAQDKVYLSFVQSDGIGIGAWNDPQRGKIPYNWEAGVDLALWAPAVMEMFVQDKTPNDYFLGWQSGYMYPTITPHDKFPGLMRETSARMAALDEHVLSIMDHTDRGIPIGYFDLPKRTVDEYYANVPGALGFINGYAAAHTFDLRHGQPFLSYDYYLDQHRPVADAAADLNELMRLNPRRPYYLVVHVRESNSIQRVIDIIHLLREHPEVVPLDTLMKLAAGNKTYETFYKAARPEGEPWDINAQ